jgi:NADH-quinone oxidoreductase subunit C
MTDEPNNRPPDASEGPTPEDGAERAPEPASSARAGTLPPPPDADQPRPTPESQAALTGKAPSGSSTSGTTVPAAAAGGGGEPPAPPRPKPAAPPSNETPEEKKARLERIIAEAKARKEAAAAAAQAEGAAPPPAFEPDKGAEPPGGKSPEVGDPTKSPSQADLEKAAKIAEAKARAAALKEAAAAKAPAAAAGAPAGAGAPKAPVKKKDEGPKPEDASSHPLVKRLTGKFAAAFDGAFTFVNQLSIHVKAEAIVEVCRHLRDDAQTRFDYLSDLTCVHWPERDDAPFELVYNLFSISKNERVRLKVAVAEEVESVTAVWPAANWMEREVYDLFGVRFRNHPDLRRLLLPEDWDGHPLRKDYPLEFMENEWTTRHLPEFTNVQQEQLAQRRAYGLEILQTPDERRVREIFRAGREVLPKEHK